MVEGGALENTLPAKLQLFNSLLVHQSSLEGNAGNTYILRFEAERASGHMVLVNSSVNENGPALRQSAWPRISGRKAGLLGHQRFIQSLAHTSIPSSRGSLNSSRRLSVHDE